MRQTETNSKLTLQQAASMLCVHKRTLQRYVTDGKIPSTYERGRQWFKRSDLEAFIATL